MSAVSVTVGEKPYKLLPFKAFKAIVAGELLSRVGDEIRALLGELREFEKEYGEEHKVRFTKAQAAERNWIVPDDAFVQPEGGEPYIDLPAIPTQEERVMFAFPRAFKLAKDEISKLLALVVIGNEEARVAEGAGELDDALERLGSTLLHEGEIGEIVELIAATIEHVKAQLAPHEEAVGKIRAFLNRATTSSPDEEEIDENDERDERKRTLTPMSVVEPSSPDSSTSSESPTDGEQTESSGALTGASS